MAEFDSKKEKAKLRRITSGLSADKKKICAGLIADASFMAEQLEKLRDYISEHGWSEEYKNGENQYGKKNSIEAESYIKLQKSYASIIKQLTDLLPDTKTDSVNQAGERLAKLVAGGKPVELR